MMTEMRTCPRLSGTYRESAERLDRQELKDPRECRVCKECRGLLEHREHLPTLNQ